MSFARQSHIQSHSTDVPGTFESWTWPQNPWDQPWHLQQTLGHRIQTPHKTAVVHPKIWQNGESQPMRGFANHMSWVEGKRKGIQWKEERKRKAIVGQRRSSLTARLSSGSWLGCLLLYHCRRTDQGHTVRYVFVDTDTHAGSVCSQTLVCPSPPWTHLREKKRNDV